MKLYSTNHKSHPVSFEEAVMNGVASDGGLFMPREIPKLPKEFFRKIHTMTLPEIAYHVTKTFLQGDIPDKAIKKIVKDTITFEAPVRKLDKDLYVLELFHGPTMSFKDFGAIFMARLISYYATSQNREITILVATSGDTGSAVAAGFYNVPGVRVILLYPKGKVSHTQEQQLTTMAGNITALEINGTFDDCQRLVKEAFLDSDLHKKLLLTSANSINIARLLGQIFYYFYVYGKIKQKDKEVVLSVPCGNFGNLTASIIAKKMGLPIARLVAATNINDVFTIYTKTGIFKPRPSQSTLSNAMDVGNPSNFVRIKELYGNSVDRLKKDIWSQSFTDRQTVQAIKDVYREYQYILDPHSAIAYLGLKAYTQSHKQEVCGIFLATAHPAKFPELIKNILQKEMQMPKLLQHALDTKKKSIELPNRFRIFKQYLFS